LAYPSPRAIHFLSGLPKVSSSDSRTPGDSGGDLGCRLTKFCNVNRSAGDRRTPSKFMVSVFPTRNPLTGDR
jgi:hypothetical protein